jgi:hypothetical protein
VREEKLKQEEKYMWAIVNGVKEKVSICGSSAFISIIREMLYLVNICMQKSMRALVHMRVSASMAYILINNGFLIADFII